jgi:hypothetical protein
MANRNSYFKSSCICACDVKQPSAYEPRQKVGDELFFKKGWGGNMAMMGCKSPLSDVICYDTLPFGTDVEPSDKQGFAKINNELEEQHLDRSYHQIQYAKKGDACEIAFTSDDPRLIDVPRAQRVALNSPPFNSGMNLTKIYTDPRMGEYGKHYRSYRDINTGDIVYYVDKSIEDPFFNPNFVTSAQMKATLYRDPMGEIKPQFERYPLKPDNHLNTTKCEYDGGLSWISDSQEFRQDLMSYQMRKHNEQRWSSMWTSTVE